MNGKRVVTGPEAGKFAAVRRTWKNGDRIEIEFDMPTILEAVDPQHPDRMAAVHGPLALFAVGDIPASVARNELLGVAQVASGSKEWQAATAHGPITLRPFTAIHDEHYRLYQKVEG